MLQNLLQYFMYYEKTRILFFILATLHFPLCIFLKQNSNIYSMLQYFQVHINLFNDEESSFVIDDENVSITLGPQVIVLGQSIMANITYQLFKRFAKSEKVLQVDHQKFLTENYVNVFAVVSCGELFEIRRYFNIAHFIIITISLAIRTFF